jgi:hypothetical protein
VYHGTGWAIAQYVCRGGRVCASKRKRVHPGIQEKLVAKFDKPVCVVHIFKTGQANLIGEQHNNARSTCRWLIWATRL